MPRPNDRYYDLLEVSSDVTKRGLEHAWRRVYERLTEKAARGDVEAAWRLADAKEAWAVLSDPERRRVYDAWGESGPPPGAATAPSTAASAPEPAPSAPPPVPAPAPSAPPPPRPMEAVSSEECSPGPKFTGEENGNAQARVVDGILEVRISFRLACTGGEAEIAIKDKGRHVIDVPPGTADGDTVEVNGVPVRFRVTADSVFRREGPNLLLALSIEEGHAKAGVVATVPTLEGEARIRIPKGIRPGQRLRLKGKGVPYPDKPGDLLVEIDVLPPDTGRVESVGLASGS